MACRVSEALEWFAHAGFRADRETLHEFMQHFSVGAKARNCLPGSKGLGAHALKRCQGDVSRMRK